MEALWLNFCGFKDCFAITDFLASSVFLFWIAKTQLNHWTRWIVSYWLITLYPRKSPIFPATILTAAGQDSWHKWYTGRFYNKTGIGAARAPAWSKSAWGASYHRAARTQRHTRRSVTRSAILTLCTIVSFISDGCSSTSIWSTLIHIWINVAFVTS